MQNIVLTQRPYSAFFFNREKARKTTRKQENSFSSAGKKNKSFIFFLYEMKNFIHIKNEGTDSEVYHTTIFSYQFDLINMFA
jgi:hypothetical protein